MPPKQEDIKAAYRDVFLNTNSGRVVLADLLSKFKFMEPNPIAGMASESGHAFMAGQRQVLGVILTSCDLTPERLFLNAQTSTPVRKEQDDE